MVRLTHVCMRTIVTTWYIFSLFSACVGMHLKAGMLHLSTSLFDDYNTTTAVPSACIQNRSITRRTHSPRLCLKYIVEVTALPHSCTVGGVEVCDCDAVADPKNPNSGWCARTLPPGRACTANSRDIVPCDRVANRVSMLHFGYARCVRDPLCFLSPPTESSIFVWGDFRRGILLQHGEVGRFRLLRTL